VRISMFCRTLAAAAAVVAALPGSAALATAACSEGQMAEAQLQFQGAQQLLETGQWDQAIANLKSIVEFCPEYYPALRGLGKAYQETGQLDLAADVYQKVIDVLAEETEAADYGNLGLVFTKQKKYREARAEYLKAKTRDPENCSVLVNLGILHNAAGFPIQAVETLEDAQMFCPDLVDKITPRLAEACSAAAAQQKQIGNADKAAMYQAKAREYGGTVGGTTAYQQIQAKMKTGDYASAVDLCDELLASDPGHANAWLTKARATDSLNRKDESIAAYRQYLTLKPDNMDETAAMIIVMAEAGQCAAALAASREALEKFAGNGAKALGKIHFAYGKAHFCAKDYSSARNEFGTAAQSGDPKWAEAAREGIGACESYLDYESAQRRKSAQQGGR